MSRNTIRGAGNKIIGYTVDRGDEITLYNEHNVRWGKYMTRMNKTYDRHGNIVSDNGNTLGMLLSN